MALNLLIIPEDSRKDQYVLRPIFAAMMASLGEANARIRIYADTENVGVDSILQQSFLESAVDGKKHIDFFILCVDRDGSEFTERRIVDWIEKCRNTVPEKSAFLGICAWQEVEAWVLLGLNDIPKQWNWSAIRAEKQCKEVYFNQFLEMRELPIASEVGLKILAVEAARNYDMLRRRAIELVKLEDQIKHWLTTRP